MHRRLILAAISTVFFVLAGPAAAHEWYSQRRDPVFSQTTCCGGSDCAPLPPHAISITPDGQLRVSSPSRRPAGSTRCAGTGSTRSSASTGSRPARTAGRTSACSRTRHRKTPAKATTASSFPRQGDPAMHRFLAPVTAALAPLLAAPAPAQTLPCAPAAAMNAELASKYGEHPVAAGVSKSGMVYVTANPESGTFTVLLRRPDGVSCILVAGRGWAQHEPANPGRETLFRRHDRHPQRFWSGQTRV